MADEVDRASEYLERIAPGQIAASKKPSGPPFTGMCHFCDERLVIGRWCDADCRDGWDQEQR